jgi:hypothetical protein
MSLCAEEMIVFCSKVKPGGGRMFNCLLENVEKKTFGSSCKEEIVKREDRAKEDYRLDAGVHEACEGDVEAFCSAERSQAHGHAEVLKCLADKVAGPSVDVSAGCQTQISRCGSCYAENG